MSYWKCMKCKKVFELDKFRTSLYEPNSFVRMAICPHCRVPRQVVEVKKINKEGVESGKDN